MLARFSHRDFRVIPFERVPLGRDIYLIAESLMSVYEASRISLFEGRSDSNPGVISFAAARAIGDDYLELSWYPNIADRFHEVSVTLTRADFIACVTCPAYDEKLHIFVRDGWLDDLYAKPFSAFAMVDAIGVKDALMRGRLRPDRLLRLRDRIDDLAAKHPTVAFVSFADNLLLKTNWNARTRSTYAPERLMRLLPEVAAAFGTELGLKIYTVVTQGPNAYEDPSLVHASAAGHHFSLNSLGLPFAQLLSIDSAVRHAIKTGAHAPCELYVDGQFYHSLKFDFEFDKHELPYAAYRDPLSTVERRYYYLDVDAVLENYEMQSGGRGRRLEHPSPRLSARLTVRPGRAAMSDACADRHGANEKPRGQPCSAPGLALQSAARSGHAGCGS